MRALRLLTAFAVSLLPSTNVGCTDDEQGAAPIATGGAGGAVVAGGSAAGGHGTAGMGTGGTDQGGTGGTGGAGGAQPPADYRLAGPYAVAETQSSLETTSGCTLEYDLYAPQGSPWSGIVVAAHGLECGRQHMADWARHWASWGLTTAAPDLCHSTTLDLDQQQNGLDLVELGAALSDGAVVYAGHSAGGLAALVAAANDPAALGSFGLDPVEWSAIGATAAGAMTTPAYGLVGGPSACNGFNNAPALYATMDDARLLRVTEADHCDFSSPNTCTPCQVGCGIGTNFQFSDEEIATTIGELSAAFMVWLAALDPAGAYWWAAGGPGYDALLDAGAIAEP